MRISRVPFVLTLIFGSIGAVASCGHSPDPAPSEVVGTNTAALSTADVTIDLAYPAGFSVANVAVGASDSLQLNDQVKLFAATGSPGAATNTGSGMLTLGNGALLGTVASVGNVKIGDRDTASMLSSSGTVTVGSTDVVGTIAQHATLTPLVHRTLTVHPPAGTPTTFDLEPGQTGTLSPGIYTSVSIKTGARVTLTAGTYVIDSLDLEPQGVLNLDTSQGELDVYVDTSVIWRGAETGDGTKFILGYLGTGMLDLESPLAGLALAPFGTLQLVSTAAGYTGAFYGKDVILQPGVQVTSAPTPLLIGSVTVSPTRVCVGQQAEVRVDASAAGPNATTWINGRTVGTHQFVEFAGQPGTRFVTAAVYTGTGGADSQTIPVTVNQCSQAPGQPPPISLRFGGTLGKPNTVEFMVHGYDSNGNEVLPPSTATYAWTFGDGQTATTASPLVDHDYTAAVNPMAPYSFFNASVAVTSGGLTSVAQKVVSIFSLYALNRGKGIIQPPNTISGISTSAVSIAVTNYEPTPLTITQANSELIPCDPALDDVVLPPQALSVVIPASSTGTVQVAPPAPFGSTICGFSYHLIGTSSAGQVFTDAYSHVGENPLLRQAVTDPAAIAVLNQASASAANPNQFDENELHQLYARGLLSGYPAAVPPGTTYQSMGPQCPNGAANVEGCPCTPGDTDSNLVCEPTSDWLVNPPQYLNAFVGQFVMEHGCGQIGQLLASINQTFSHAGVMTKNRVEIQHSTAASDRITGSVGVLAGSLQLDPNKLKYAFPGTATPVSVDQIVHTYCSPADPTGTGSGSATCPNGWDMGNELNPSPEHCNWDGVAVPPIVVRSTPLAPASVAQAVAAAGGPTGAGSIQSHYRFDVFSHADQNLVGPTTSGIADWAEGTIGAVSSSFPRLSIFKQNVPLWPSNRLANIPDGMRPYTTQERRTAGNTLFSVVSNQVGAACKPSYGILPAIFLPAVPGDVVGVPAGGLTAAGVTISSLAAITCTNGIASIANQLVNCFASDACNDTGDDWRSTGAGVSVSEDDVTHWDPWTGDVPTSGTYGYNEPLVYLPTSFRHNYVWTAAPGASTLTVLVENPDGSPIPGATVIVDSDIKGTTGSTGSLTFSEALGSHDVEAQQFLPGIVLPPPQPPPLDAAGILALPACPAAPVCQTAQSTCPNQYFQGSCEVAPCVDTDENQECATDGPICSCNAPQIPSAACDFEEGGRSATVTSGATTVVVTLCQGANCTDAGVQDASIPQACLQRCMGSDDCTDGLTCSGQSSTETGTCVAPQQVVEITGTSLVTVAEYNLLGCVGAVANFVPYTITCDPSMNATVGGTPAHFTNCSNDGSGDQDTLDWQVTCDQDVGSPGIIVNNTVKLMRNCGSGAQDKNDTIQFQAGVLPGSPTVLTNGFACFSDSVFCPTQSNCANTDNGGSYDDLLLDTITYTIEPKPTH